MNIAVRYYTRSGNTKKLAEAIAAAAGVKARPVSVPLTEKADLVFLGSSVYGGGVDEAIKVFVRENAEKIGELVNFSTAALVSSTYKQVKKLAEAHGVPLAQEEFHCRGSFLIMHPGRPNHIDLKNAEAFAKQVIAKR